MIAGDRYCVYCTRFSASGTHGSSANPHDSYLAASADQKRLGEDPDVQSVWIMVDNQSLGLQPKRAGYTMRKERS